MESYESLRESRPIYTTLPEIYSEFTFYDRLTDSAYLVEFWEQIFQFWNRNLSNFLNFDGDFDNFTDNQLKALAPFFGFSGDWFNLNWTRDQLIQLFLGVYHPPYIWINRGSLAVLNYVLDVLMIPGNLSKQSGFIAGLAKAGDICGSPNNAEYILYVPENLSPSTYDDIRWVLKRFIPLHIHITPVVTQDQNLVSRPSSPFLPT